MTGRVWETAEIPGAQCDTKLEMAFAHRFPSTAEGVVEGLSEEVVRFAQEAGGRGGG